MGLCGSGGMSKQEKERQKEIEAQLRKDKRIIDQEIKLLLLGAGESGKSTMSKQMKIIHLSGFNEDERKSYIEIICSNIITSMKALVAATEKLDIETEEKNKDAIQNIMNASVILNSLSTEMIRDLKSLWEDKGIQKAFERRNQFQLTDSAAYYFNSLDRIGDPNYIPDTQDVLRSRAKTTGITETEFDVSGVHFRMVDVGGQRSERKKWIHCFQDVTAVIFCVAMSEYDLKLFEDETVNRSEESLKLFDEICNSKWFGTTSIILFLNKKDLFAEKIKTIDLNVCFPEYTGGCDFEAASQYLQNKFLSLNRNPAQKNVYPHLTCATDTQSVTFVFNSVKDIILNNVLGDGFI